MLYAVEKQTYKNFELIIVNDHSKDETENIVRSFAAKWKNIQIINSERSGKKNALKEGIAIATGNIIIQTDADCTFSEKWLETIVSYFIQNSETDLLIGPVKIESSGAIFNEMQALEFLSLVASGAGSCGIGQPIMCNGANLAYSRKIWLEASAYLHEEVVSGDDIFLLQYLKKNKKNIAFLKNQEGIVYTKAVKSVNSFIRQRQRWASKSTEYQDLFTIFTSFSVFGLSLLQIILLFTQSFSIFCFVFILKLIIDSIFLIKTSPFFGLQKTLRWIPIVAFFYPVYILFCSTSGIFRKKEWEK